MTAKRWSARLLFAASALVLQTASATEVTTYSYDELGRLVETVASGPGTTAKSVDMTIDDAGNRSNLTVTDASAELSVNDVSVTEGGNLIFTVTRAGNLAPAVTVRVDTQNGTATSTYDYAAIVNQTVSFAAFATSANVTVATNNNSWWEPTEYMSLKLSNPSSGVTIIDSTGIGTIYNN